MTGGMRKIWTGSWTQWVSLRVSLGPTRSEVDSGAISKNYEMKVVI